MILKTRGADTHLRTNGLEAFGIQFQESGVAQPAVTLTPHTARGIPAVTQAVRIAATAVAMLDLGVYTGQDVSKRQVKRGPMAQLFAGEPNDQQSIFEFKETIEESLSFRGNAYVWLNTDPRTGFVVEWFALHPGQVFPIIGLSTERRYQVLTMPMFIDPVGKGTGYYNVGPETILHVRGHGNGGRWIAPSPVEVFRLSLARALAKIGHENSVYGKGASVRGVIQIPDSSPTQLKAVKETWKETYEGVHNAGKTAVLGGGGTFTPIGLNMADAQFVETQQFDVEEVARMLNVPASIMGGGSSNRAQAPLTPEHETQRWLSYGLGGRLMRIESAMQAHPALFNGKPDPYPWFKTDGLVRGDAATNAAIILGQVQSGQLLIDEARALNGRGPLADGVGQIPQITPVGGAPNPSPPASGITHPNDTQDGQP